MAVAACAGHVDGPARDAETLEEIGRYHKLFVMVEKAGGAQQTNVKVIPAHALYAHRCDLDALAGEEARGEPGWFNDTWPRDAGPWLGLSAEERLRRRTLRAWGVVDTWPGLEALSCAVPMEAGDLLFFREDVWHRHLKVEHI